jgi:hypothetical protein
VQHVKALPLAAPIQEIVIPSEIRVSFFPPKNHYKVSGPPQSEIAWRATVTHVLDKSKPEIKSAVNGTAFFIKEQHHFL